MVAGVVAVDISGRHEEDGRYLMVCAAVSARLTSDAVASVDDITYEVVETREDPSFEVVAETVRAAVPDDAGVVVAERGEFYGEPAWLVEGAVGQAFKYVETIAERKAVEIAHHAAYGGREMLKRRTGSPEDSDEDGAEPSDTAGRGGDVGLDGDDGDEDAREA